MDNNNLKKKAETQHALDIEIFKIITEHFRQDIREFWTRANFYLLAQTGLFSVFAATYSTLVRSQAIIAMSVPILGLVIAIISARALEGSHS